MAKEKSLKTIVKEIRVEYRKVLKKYAKK